MKKKKILPNFDISDSEKRDCIYAVVLNLIPDCLI